MLQIASTGADAQLMQDQCAGGVGDFMKLGLLRWLVAPSPFAPQAKLGVVWYRVANDCAPADCENVAYLDPSSAAGRELRPLDPDLYDRLRTVVADGRPRIESLAASGALPRGTRYFDRALDFTGLGRSDRDERTVRRERWFHEAMVSTDSCSLVFMDPDDGLSYDDQSISGHGDGTEKHAYLSEVARILARGQSVVVSHMPEQAGTAIDQAVAVMAEIDDALGVEPVAAIRASRQPERLLLVIPHDERHRCELDDRLGALQLSNWADELRMYRQHRTRTYA